MLPGVIRLNREESLQAIERFQSEAREIASVCEQIGMARDALEGSWKGRAASQASLTFEEVGGYLTQVQDALLRHCNMVGDGVSTLAEADEFIASKLRGGDSE